MQEHKFQEIVNRIDFIKVPNRLIKDDKLNPSAKWCYMVLVAHRNGTTGKCYPSQETIAKVTELSLKQCNRAIQELEDKQYISVSKHYQKGGTRCNNMYTFKDSLDKEFTMVKTDVILKILQKGLTHKHIVLYISLRRFTNNGTNFIKDITRTELVRLTGVNIKTLKAQLTELAEAKVIEVTDSQNYCNCINIDLKFENELRQWEVM